MPKTLKSGPDYWITISNNTAPIVSDRSNSPFSILTYGGPGYIKINTTPVPNTTASQLGATIYLDDKLQTNKLTNATLYPVDPGTHAIRLTRSGYLEPETQFVSVEPGWTTPMFFVLAGSGSNDADDPQSPLYAGKLTITSNVPAEIFMVSTSSSSDEPPVIFTSEDSTGFMTNTGPIGIDPGTYVIKLKRDGYTPEVRTVTVGAGGTVTENFELTSLDIAAAGVTGFTAPATGGTPDVFGALTPGSAQYTVTGLTWTPAGDPYSGSTVYTAHVTLTSASGYKFPAAGIAVPTANTGTVGAGTTAGGDVTGNTLTFTVTFPATANAIANIAAAGVTGFTAPATGGTPDVFGDLAPGSAQYTVTGLTWTPAGDPYSGSTVYVATVTLTSASGYKFPAAGIAVLTADGGPTSVSAGTTAGGDVTGNTLAFTVTYPATAPAIANIAPVVVGITANRTDPVPIKIPISFNASFTDADTADTHTAMWNWEGSISTGTVSESNGAGKVSNNHNYTSPGVYTVTLNVTDNHGATGFSPPYQYVVVYDPEAGFVTGGGWINSPVGAYVLDPTMTGKATFGFVSKYPKGKTIPTGNTEFQFHAASMNFQSTNYEWLVVSGAKAQYKGNGTINSAGNYGFMLSAIDGQVSGGGGTDKFRIKISNKTSGILVYDNQKDASDDAAPTTVIGGGSIVVHK